MKILRAKSREKLTVAHTSFYTRSSEVLYSALTEKQFNALKPRDIVSVYNSIKLAGEARKFFKEFLIVKNTF
jgi:hypothetical protein